MIRGLYTAVSGLITLEAKQDTISNNLANVNTNGYKAENLSVKKFKDVMIENKDKVVGGKNVINKLGTLSFGAAIDETNVSFTQGVLQDTGRDLDFAIDGRGFFSVKRGENIFFTRDGQFRVNAAGYLVTSEGDSVLGKKPGSTEAEPIFVGDGKLVVDQNNNVSINGIPTYKLQVADFNNYSSDLQKVGDNLYTAKGTAIYNANVYVKQGAIEKSNVNLVNEMVNMMTVMRSFESNQKVVQVMDETLGKAANEIGAVK